MSSTPQFPPATTDQRALMQKYPGLLPQEASLFDAWWRVNQAFYDTADFNVRVGQGVDPGPQFDESIRRMAILNSQFRLDALLLKGSIYYIVEVKIRPTPLPIGQLLTYKVLWMQDNPTKGTPALLLLTTSNTPDMQTVAAAYSITLLGQ